MFHDIYIQNVLFSLGERADDWCVRQDGRSKVEGVAE